MADLPRGCRTPWQHGRSCEVPGNPWQMAEDARHDGRARVQVPFAAADVALATEREKTAQAIAAFASLGQRLDALAAERAKPWWRRLAG
jgi:hypothetical protein